MLNCRILCIFWIIVLDQIHPFVNIFFQAGLSCSFNIVFHRAKIFKILMKFSYQSWLPRWLSGKESACQCMRQRFDPWVRKVSWRRKRQPTPVFLPGKSRGRWNLVGYSLWGCKESDTTERLHFRK